MKRLFKVKPEELPPREKDDKPFFTEEEMVQIIKGIEEDRTVDDDDDLFDFSDIDLGGD